VKIAERDDLQIMEGALSRCNGADGGMSTLLFHERLPGLVPECLLLLKLAQVSPLQEHLLLNIPAQVVKYFSDFEVQSVQRKITWKKKSVILSKD
jgi:hypothetical protein